MISDIFSYFSLFCSIARLTSFTFSLEGNAMQEDVAEFISNGADAVLTKPLKMQDLEKILQHLRRNGFKSKVGADGQRFLF